MKKQVLVVDDDLNICREIKDALQDETTDVQYTLPTEKILHEYMRQPFCIVGFPKGSSSNDKIYVMVPRYLRGGNGATTNYLYGDLQNALVKGTSGVTKTLYGRAKSVVGALKMEVYAPNATRPSYTFNASISSVVSGSVLFNQTGDWKVVVSSSGLRSFTYIVRVV